MVYDKLMRTQFFTGAGDKGESALGGEKLSKSDLLFYVLGSLDELNSWLGLCRVEAALNAAGSIDVSKEIKNIQETLFIIQAELYALESLSAHAGCEETGKKIISRKVGHLEDLIKNIDEILPKIDKFIIAGGSELSARLDVARALSRRAERLTVSLSKNKKLSPDIIRYLNRLSSALFALARYINYNLNIKEDNPAYI